MGLIGPEFWIFSFRRGGFVAAFFSMEKKHFAFICATMDREPPPYDRLRAVEAEYAALRGLTREDLETLSELVPCIAREEERMHEGVDRGTGDAENECYRLRYEAAEARYGRMKALVCASLEAQMRLKARINGQLAVETLQELGLGDSAAVGALLGQRTLDESQRRETVDELWRLVRELRPDERATMRRSEADVELAVAQQKIFALELELNRLNDKVFEDDERVRECEDVLERIMFRPSRPPAADESAAVPRRFHPMVTCAELACQSYARRLRSGLKQAVAEAYVRDRNVRIHGHVRSCVESAERLRFEKDREIHRLRFELARLERATGQWSADVTLEHLDAAVVLKKLELDSLGAQAQRMREETQALITERDRWRAALQAEQGALREAEARVEEARSLRARMELRALETDEAEFERLAARMEGFNRVGDPLDEEDRGPGRRRGPQDEAASCDDEEDDDGGGKRARSTVCAVKKGGRRKPTGVCLRDGGIVVPCCRCKEEVPLREMERHAADAHGGALLCPNGCGFFIPSTRPGRQTDMVRHIKGQACLERLREIRRLEKEDGLGPF